MSVARELRRCLRADPALSRFEPCLPRLANEPPAGPAGFTKSSMTASASLLGAMLQACALSRETVTTSPIAFPSS